MRHTHKDKSTVFKAGGCERFSCTHHEAHHVDTPNDAPAAPRCLQQGVRPTFVHRAAVQDSTMDAADSAALRPGRKRRTSALMKIGRGETLKAGPELRPCLQPGGGGNLIARVSKHPHARGGRDQMWLSKESLARVRVKRPEAAGRLKCCLPNVTVYPVLLHWTPLRLRRPLAPSSDVT